MLEAAIAAFETQGARSGGAVEPARRRRALAAYRGFGGSDDEAALGFGGLRWSSERVRLPPRSAGRPEESGGDVPALALANAGGIVHAGSTLLEPASPRLPHGVTLAALADARHTLPERVRAVHGSVVAADAGRFTALATAFQNCGAYVEIAAGTQLVDPVQLVWTGRPGEASAIFPHVVVRVGAGARAVIVERHLGETESLLAGIVEIEAAAGARLDYVVVQHADEDARLLVHRAARCAAAATVAWHLADLGGAFVRTVLGADLRGARAGAEINAFHFARGFAHAGLRVELRHGAAGTTSRTTVRRAATDRGQGRFAAAVELGSAATQADVALHDDALLLARGATLSAAPLLDIGADRIAVAQTTSVGSLDEEKLFYVQSRGIARALAERMMALAFFEPAIAAFPSDALRDEVRTALDERLDEVPGTF